MDYEELEVLEESIRKKDLLIDILLERIEDNPHYNEKEYNNLLNRVDNLQSKYDELYVKYTYVANQLHEARKNGAIIEVKKDD